MTAHHTPTVTSASKFTVFTLIAAVVAAAAAFTTLSLSLLPWAMFVGWVAWFTRPADTRQAVQAVLCTWLGMALAMIGEVVVGALAPSIGVTAALPIGVFLLALVVVGLRTTPVVGNMLAWFVGLVAYFAAEPEHPLPGIATLVAASAIGALAAFTCQALQRRFAA